VVADQDAVSEVAEHAGEQRSHRTPSADDGDRKRLCLVRQLGAQCRLVIATRAKQDAEECFHLALGKSHFLGTSRPVFEDLALALRITDPQVMLAFVGSDFRNDGHAACCELQQLVVERIDHGAE
jgi:hypothetical protein